MHNKSRVLFLSPYLPAVDTTACARKIYDNIVLLSKRGYFIYLVSFCSGQDAKRVDSIKPYCAQLHLLNIKDYFSYPKKSRSLRKKVKSICETNDIDIVQCEKSYMAKYLPKNSRIPFILVEHEILSVSFFERAKTEKNFAKRIIFYLKGFKKLFLDEKSWYLKFNKIIVFTDNDKQLLKRLFRLNNIEVIPLGVNLKDYSLARIGPKTFDLIFAGNFSHWPNVDAVLYFCNEILPIIKKGIPEVSILIIGSGPTPEIKRLEELNPNIVVKGFVEDIKELYFKCKVAVVPVRFGTGMRFKTLEALALGLPVIATSIGARGIEAGGIIKIADTKEEFAKGVIELLSNTDKCNYFSERGMTLAESLYNWDNLLNSYENIFHNFSNV